jgi:predicted MPP superfamily phosphohydrolase
MAPVIGRTNSWLRWWHLVLGAFLVAVGLWLSFSVARRALILVALVPVAFWPFCYARQRFHRSLERVLADRHPMLVLMNFWLGAALDGVMVAQLLSARTEPAAAFLHDGPVAWTGAVWFSAYALLFVAYVLVGLGRRIEVLTRRTMRRPRPPREEVSLERRAFVQNFGVMAAGLPFAVSLSGVQVSYDFQVEEYEIHLPHLPPALDGLRVAHLSDIHVGGAMDLERLRHVAQLTNASKPDLVLHTGDFLTHRLGNFDEPLYEALAEIKVPYGQWACFGNHDYDNPTRLTRRLHEAGVEALRNRLVTIDVGGQPVEIAGLDYLYWGLDREAKYANLIGAWGQRDATARILLNHDPRAFGSLPQGCADLVLSGHTHGGHVGVQLGKGRALTVVGLAGIPDQGVFERGDMRMFVTRCVGFYGYPMRVGIPPEIAVLTLRSAVQPSGEVASADSPKRWG